MRECPACKLCFPDAVKTCPKDNEATIHSISGEPILDGRYQLISRLGQGGMGVVYKARHTYLKTLHAIKVILPDLVGNDPNLATRFRQEALAAAAIRHRNIVSVTDFGVVAGNMPFLVMEFVEGESLHDLLVRERRLNPNLALEVLSAICSGLAAAHRQGIVHRDLKPLNVIIQRGEPLSDAVKILDFGLAKIKSGELLGSFIQAQTTGLMGSPYYMAPEQWSDDEPDQRADVYSLGVMLYQMLAGEVPFKGTSIPSIMKKHLSDPPPSLIEAGLDVSPEIERVIRHALEKDREERTPSVEKLVEELREALARNRINQKLGKSDSGSYAAPPVTKVAPPQQELVTVLRVLSIPPGSQVFLDGNFLGRTEANGWLVAEGVKRGRHQIRVVNEGFAVWEQDVDCIEESCQVVAQLTSLLATNVSSVVDVSAPNLKGNQPANLATAITDKPIDVSAAPDLDLSIPLAPAEREKTNQQTPAKTQPFGLKSYPEVKPETVKPEIKPETGKIRQETLKTDFRPEIQPLVSPESQFEIEQTPSKIKITFDQVPTRQKKSSLGLVLVLVAFVIGIIVVAGGGYTAYRLLFPGTVENPPPQVNNDPPKDDPIETPPAVDLKPEMVKITGGSFMMGNNNSDNPIEKPAHNVNVADFEMSKYEVTNAEYAQFVEETSHQPVPETWVNNKPIKGQEKHPVVLVSLDDARAYAKWRSQKDNVTYRLPTEIEWEYAARNGAEGNLFPWGNEWEISKAVVDKASTQPVGSIAAGQNKWGVHDLLGNVWEWTETPLKPYPGYKGDPILTGAFVFRGGGFRTKPDNPKEKVTATYRNAYPAKERNPQVGFRLVTPGS